ncbi:D-alanyl-D-alanine carboxypeptidase [Aquicella siphonis]|uniref:D-alanyl-D-alanine carboxypeptidase n=1 Tax=Aquicella siphonis TaxID=254247 RepID=A0A5E4PGK1_9COXI|nr:D-alanyl-D-alanine carboxypeptidase [Aquicella siphonis]
MTSGIPSYTRDPVFSEKLENDIRAEWTDEELVSYAHPDEPIESGQNKFDYSNTNYILAGMIIEKITNDSLANQLHKRILDNSSYSLKNTYYVAGKNWKAIQDSIMPRMVHGYFYDHETKKLLDTTANNLSWGAAAGAMISNTTDIIHWVQALYHGKIFPDKYKDRELKNLKSVVSMKTGRSIATVTPQDPNGFGLGVGSLYKDPGGQFWYYEGSGLGYRTAYIWKSCNNVTVAAALNSKGGEGNPNAPEGDHILELMFKIYDEIITAYPRYNCDD